jgi:hypothetical protein
MWIMITLVLVVIERLRQSPGFPPWRVVGLGWVGAGG